MQLSGEYPHSHRGDSESVHTVLVMAYVGESVDGLSVGLRVVGLSVLGLSVIGVAVVGVCVLGAVVLHTPTAPTDQSTRIDGRCNALH